MALQPIENIFVVLNETAQSRPWAFTGKTPSGLAVLERCIQHLTGNWQLNQHITVINKHTNINPPAVTQH